MSSLTLPQVLRLRLPAEVQVSESKCQRSKVNGSLLIVMPKVGVCPQHVLLHSMKEGQRITYSMSYAVLCYAVMMSCHVIVVSGESERTRDHNNQRRRCEGEKERHEEQGPASGTLLLFRQQQQQ